MRWSTAFIPTLRDTPSEAEAVSHKLLLRAGYMRPLMSGHYTLLPLAVKVRQKLINIIREEMDAFGAQEILVPVVQPAEIWKQSGRYDGIDEAMFRFKDRKDQDVVLMMTGEEAFTVAFSEVQSYKELPMSLYQFQTKLRDEARPKSGLLRVREFTMKDSYSFDIDQDGLDKSFEAHRQAYINIFKRFGLKAYGVEASNGSMGGEGSIEFQVPAAIGEDIIVLNEEDGYAANIENATSILPAIEDEAGPDAPEQFDTPGVRTIKQLAEFTSETGDGGAEASRQIKTLVFVIDGETVLAIMRGDDELVEQLLLDAAGGDQIRPATPEEIKPLLGASPGSLGAVGVTDIPVYADNALKGRTNMTTGANIDDKHFRGVNVERDITVTKWAPLRRVRAGEGSPISGKPLTEINSIESGHIFKLGTKYIDAFDAKVAGPDNSVITPLMGCYGIGIDRNMAVIVETHNDEKGIVWPVAVAPFEVVITALTANDEATMSASESLYNDLKAQRFDVLFDDRDARTGVKLADAELIGIPVRVAVGKRGLASGTLEVTVRSSGETIEIPVEGAADAVAKIVRDLAAAELAQMH